MDVSVKVFDLQLSGLKLIQARAFYDERGFFWECYRRSSFEEMGIADSFVQDNHAFSKKNALRGMHFQRSPGQAKMISVMDGEILDVVVDIRPTSPTYKQWMGITLSSRKHEQLYIPVGFAHGYCVLSEEAHVLYKVSSNYDPAEEKGFRFDDPEIGIDWPIPHPLISERDLAAPLFREVFSS